MPATDGKAIRPHKTITKNPPIMTNPTLHAPSRPARPGGKFQGIGIGLKILGGVALVSNLCIGALLYGHLHSGDTLAGRVDELLLVKERLNEELRATVASLQNDLLSLPNHFKNDTSANLLAGIEKSFNIVEKERLQGREAFSRLFDRNQRRDLTKGLPVVLGNGESLRLALPDRDEQGNFTDSVTVLTLQSRDATDDQAGLLLSELEKLDREHHGETVLRSKVATLLANAGDAALAAEKSRTEILRQVERIRAMEELVAEVRGEQRRFSLLMGGLAVTANLVALLLLTRVVVERPLRRLTEAVESIAGGRAVEIPYGERRDQIGILAGALHGFRAARQRLEEEGRRRELEKAVMEEMLAKLTTTVTILDDRAKLLADGAQTLRQAAETTLARAEGVGRQARETAERSLGVADGAALLQRAVNAINTRLDQHNQIAAALLTDNAEGQRHLGALDTSLAAISSLLATLGEINDQTKLLSLNATIEAATAGAAGKGFAVVASEIKALSQKTAEATRGAKERLAAINDSRRVLVAHLDKVHGQIERQEEHSREILSAISEQRRVSGDIADLAGESSAISDETSRSIALVAEEAASSLQLAAKVHDAAGDISRRLGDLLEEGRSRLGSILEVAPATNPVSAPPHPSSISPLPAAPHPAPGFRNLPRLAVVVTGNSMT